MKESIYYFPVRHLSPSCAYHLVSFLEDKNPDCVLIEGPSDGNHILKELTDERVVPPIALLAYTLAQPVKSILYPFAEYSPEYQAALWAADNQKHAEFIDLPCSVFLAMKKETSLNREDCKRNIYQELAESYDEMDYETFWERNFERPMPGNEYFALMEKFGEGIRMLTEKKDFDSAESLVREAYMKAQIEKAKTEYGGKTIVVVTGAYHTSALKSSCCIPLTMKEMKKIPSVSCNLTIMPYSYYRLSSRSGYGAGNAAPFYFELMWETFREDIRQLLPERYMTLLAGQLRKSGHIKSSAEVIEAVRLAKTLAAMQNGVCAVLTDLRDGAKTCLGEGEFSAVAKAAAATEVGTKIGSLPDGMSHTAIQNDFNYCLKDLKLESYRSLCASELKLDLRENRRVKSEKAAFLDLHRSFFLHRLKLCNVTFGELQGVKTKEKIWKEDWVICWRPETEIQLIETALAGDSIYEAAAAQIQSKLDECNNVREAADIILSCFECGLIKIIPFSISVIRDLGTEASSLEEISSACLSLSAILRFGNVRRLETSSIEPVLSQLFYKACLVIMDSADCDLTASKTIKEAIENLDTIISFHEEIVEAECYLQKLEELAESDNCNPLLSGVACSLLLERNRLSKDELARQLERRLLPGIPADFAAGWFEGLAARNHYILLAAQMLWEKLDQYIISLDKDELKLAAVFLHRTFSRFSPEEKYMIAENLGNLWGINQDELSENLEQELTIEEENMLKGLEEFDFDDI